MGSWPPTLLWRHPRLGRIIHSFCGSFGSDICVYYGAELTCYICTLTVICTYQNRKGQEAMKTKFYINGKKTTRKAVKESIGVEQLEKMVKDAKETYREDPLIQNDFFLGSKGMLTIEFEF